VLEGKAKPLLKEASLPKLLLLPVALGACTTLAGRRRV